MRSGTIIGIRFGCFHEGANVLGNILSRPYPFKFFKGCLPQILHGPFLNIFSHMTFECYWKWWNIDQLVSICFYKAFSWFLSKLTTSALPLLSIIIFCFVILLFYLSLQWSFNHSINVLWEKHSINVVILN